MSSTYKSSYCQLKNWYNMSQKFLNDSKMLYEKYAPLENKISTDNLKKRNEEIFTWFHQNMMLLAKEKIHKKDFKDMILMSQGSFYFRHGLDRTFSYMENYNIPMYIVSGGVQPVIEESLRLLVHDYEDLKKRGLLKIVANGLTFNRSTNLIEDYDRRITSTFNKADRLRESYLSDFDKEDNIILMGDHFGDSEIASKVPHKNVLKIAYYNDINLTPTNPTLYKKFQNDFDVLIEGDGSLAFINEILHKSLFSEDR